ncbi:MAG: hypothetical protein AABX55_00075 [Nanoarchaeota archaeon]
MNRRDFLKLPLLYYFPNGKSSLEDKVRSRAHKSKHLSLESIAKIKNIGPLKENDFVISYDIFDDSLELDIPIDLGDASIRYSKEKGVLDLGIDEFSLTVKFFSMFSKSVDSILNLENIRYFVEFDKKFRWIRYRENFTYGGLQKEDSNLYEREGSMLSSNGKKSPSNKKLHNPLSLIFEILNGNNVKNFEMIANGIHSKNLTLSYSKFNDDVSIVEGNFDKSVIGKFKSFYALLCNNIPIAGYIYQKGRRISYVRGELRKIKINGEDII